MQSSGRLEKLMEGLLTLREVPKPPTNYSDAYLSGRDMIPLFTLQQQQPQMSTRDNVHTESSGSGLMRPKRKDIKKKNPPSQEKLIKPALLTMDVSKQWCVYIMRDEKIMEDGFMFRPYSDAYISCMPSHARSYFMSDKFNSPLKNLKESMSRCLHSIPCASSIEADAINSDELKLAIRFAVGKMIKNRIWRLGEIPDEVKRDIEIVF